MALSAAATRLRRDVGDLVSFAGSDLDALWAQVRTAAEVEAALRDVLPALIAEYGASAGTIAAEWYDDLRDRAAVRGSFAAIPADIADPGAQALVGWALTEANDLPAFQTLILGGTQRRIANYARQTVTASSVADPQARGWQRAGAGECDFCAMLLGRGAVYTEATADFQSHDHCRCQAEPAF